MNIVYRGGAAPMTKASSSQAGGDRQTSELRNPPLDAPLAPRACATGEQAECPRCAGTMRLWAGFYRCPNCGFKESCCF